MSRTDKKSKIISIALSLALVTGGLGYLSLNEHVAKAEEPTPDAVAGIVEEDEGTPGAPNDGNGSDVPANQSDTLEPDTDEGAGNEQGEPVEGNSDENGSGDEGDGEEPGNVDLTGIGDTASTSGDTDPNFPNAKVVEPGDMLVGQGYDAGIGIEDTFDANNLPTALTMEVEASDLPAFVNRDKDVFVKILCVVTEEESETYSVIFDSRDGDSDMGTLSVSGNKYVFNFDPGHLTLSGLTESDIPDGTPASITLSMLVSFEVPYYNVLQEQNYNFEEDEGVLVNVRVPIGAFSCKLTETIDGSDKTGSFASPAGTMVVFMPNLKGEQFETDRKKGNVYDEVTYTVIVTNEGLVPAEGIRISDEDLSNIKDSPFGIVPKEESVEIYGQDAEGSDFLISVSASVSPNIKGGIEINIPDFSLIPNESIKVTYTVIMGTDAMRTNKSILESFKNKYGATVEDGKRKVTISAANQFGENPVSTHFDLVFPTVSSFKTTITNSDNSDSIEISEGDTLKIEHIFKVEGAEGSKLVNPRFDIKNGTGGILKSGTEYIKYNSESHQSYNSGDVFDDHECSYGDFIAFGYEVEATSQQSQNHQLSFVASCSADNLVDDCTSTAAATISAPEITVSASVDKSAPSAEDFTDTEHPVEIKIVVKNSGTADGHGARITISDAPAAGSVDPVAEKFKYLSLDTKEIDGIKIGNEMKIDIPVIEKGQETVIKYQDILKRGAEISGAQNKITATLSAQNTSSNILTNSTALPGSASFTVATPSMSVEQEITGPLVETPEAVEKDSSKKDAKEADNKDKAVPVDVVNAGDTVTYKTTFFEQDKDAYGRDFEMSVKISDLGKEVELLDKNVDSTKDAASGAKDATGTGATYSAAQLGISFCPVDEMKITNESGEPVTAAFDIEPKNSGTELVIKPKAKTPQDAPDTPHALEFGVKMGSANGENNFDQLSGRTIKLESVASLSNLAAPAVSSPGDTNMKIASAKLFLQLSAKQKEITRGTKNTYTITATNDENNEFDSSSRARNMVIQNGLDEAAQKLGYKIDTASLAVKMGDDDLTSTSDVKVDWNKEKTGFEMSLSKDLKKDTKLVITYNAVTDAISPKAYSETLGNVVVARADNAKPAVASENVLYEGAQVPEDEASRPAGYNDNDSNGYGNGSDGYSDADLSETGDILVYVVGGIAALAVIGLIVAVIVRRRNR